MFKKGDELICINNSHCVWDLHLYKIYIFEGYCNKGKTKIKTVGCPEAAGFKVERFMLKSEYDFKNKLDKLVDE